MKKQINVVVIQYPGTYIDNEKIVIRFHEELDIKIGDELFLELVPVQGGNRLDAHIRRKETDGEEK